MIRPQAKTRRRPSKLRQPVKFSESHVVSSAISALCADWLPPGRNIGYGEDWLRQGQIITAPVNIQCDKIAD